MGHQSTVVKLNTTAPTGTRFAFLSTAILHEYLSLKCSVYCALVRDKKAVKTIFITGIQELTFHTQSRKKGIRCSGQCGRNKP